VKSLKISLKAEIVLGAVLILIAALRIPTLFEPYWYGDEGIFAAVANGILNHQTLYTQIWDNKPPLIYLTYASVFKFFGPSMFALRATAAIFVVATGYLIFEIARHTLGLKRAFMALVIFTFLQAQIALEANLALTEIFLIFYTTLAFWVYVRFRERKMLRPYFLAGIALGVGFMYKQVGALDAAALGFFVLFAEKGAIKKDFLLTAGFLVPAAIVALVTISNQTFQDFIFAAFTYYRIYLKEGPGLPPMFGVLKVLPVLLTLAYFLYLKKAKQSLRIELLFLIWLSFAILGSLFSGRPYGHYLVQTLPAISLSVASIRFSKQFRSVGSLATFTTWGAIAIILILAFSTFISHNDPLKFGYWRNFLTYAKGDMSHKAYSDTFDRNAAKLDMAANYLKLKGASGQYLYIWGEYAWLYPTSGAINSSKYVTSFHVFGIPTGRDEVSAELKAHEPLFIVVAPNNIGYFDQLSRLINTKYKLDIIIDDVQIYRKI